MIETMTEAEAWRMGNVVMLGQQRRLINNAREVAARRCERSKQDGQPVVISIQGRYLPAMILPKQNASKEATMLKQKDQAFSRSSTSSSSSTSVSSSTSKT